jgi:hypothetical protein
MAKKSGGGQPFRHGPAQGPAPSGGRVGGPLGKAPVAQGIKNSALGAGTIGNGVSQGATFKGGIRPSGPRSK